MDRYDSFAAGEDRTLLYAGKSAKMFWENGDSFSNLDAPDHQFVRVQDTDGGKWLTDLKTEMTALGVPDAQQDQLWKSASCCYVSNAEGKVIASTAGSRDGSVFQQHELQLAIQNENVTDINGIDRQSLLDGKSALEDRGQDWKEISPKVNQEITGRSAETNLLLHDDIGRESWGHGHNMAGMAEENDRAAQQQTQSMNKGHGMEHGD